MSYRYDHFNRRIQARSGLETDSFTWGTASLLEERQGSGARVYQRAGDA